MVSFPLFPLWSLRHIIAQPDPQGSMLLIPVLAQLSRSKGHPLILFTFFKYTQQFCTLTGKWSGKNSDPDTNHVRWHEYVQKSKVIPFPAGYWEPIFMATNCCHVGTANMSEPVITLKNSQPRFSLKYLLQTKKKLESVIPVLGWPTTKTKLNGLQRKAPTAHPLGREIEESNHVVYARLRMRVKNVQINSTHLISHELKKKNH